MTTCSGSFARLESMPYFFRVSWTAGPNKALTGVSENIKQK
jgi:hypothetical protein